MSQEKKKMPRKRMLSFMLALCMILTAFPATSLWAAGEQTESANVTVSGNVDNTVEENTDETEAVSETIEETPTAPEEKSNTYNNIDETENPGAVDGSENALNKIDVAPNEDDSPEPKASNGTMSGNCGKDGGDNVKWRLESDGLYNTLIISGTGEMEDYDGSYNAPWHAWHNNIRNITIGEGVTNIGKQAFTSYGSDLFVSTNVNISNTVTKIGLGAFSGCKNLIDLNIPDSVITIENSAFASCSRLTNVKMSNSIISIGASAFGSCHKLSNIDLPNSISRIGSYAFEYCYGLTDIDIPGSVTKIEKHTFYNCDNLVNVDISEGVTIIDDSAFCHCDRLTNINIPNSMISISARAFSSCSNLPSIFIPGDVTSIAIGVFDYCVNLKDIYYEGGPISWKSLDNYIATNTFNDGFVITHSAGSPHTAKLHFNSKPEDRKQQYAIAYMNDKDKAQEVFDCSLEDCLKDDEGQNKDSSKYNPQLAHMAIAMCNSIHSAWCTELTYQNLGFDAQIRVGDNLLTYGVGTKKIGEETLVLVIARGTANIVEIADNLHIGINKNYHQGFHDAADVLYNGVVGFLQQRGLDLKDNSLRFVITGHSRGAAAANIMAARLVKEEIHQNNIYAYTFACPDVAMITKDTADKYKCIYNINNANDSVSWIPNYMYQESGYDYNPDWDRNSYWDKYGKSYWYADDWNDYKSFERKLTPHILGKDGRLAKYHLQGLYLGYLRSEKTTDSYKGREETTKIINDSIKKQEEEKPKIGGRTRLIGGFCPVDIEVYTSSGSLVGSVTNNVIDDIKSNSVYISVYGDKKYIHLLGTEDYILKFKATDDGMMKYFVRNLDPEPDGTFKEKVFENVALTNGKVMTSQVSVWDDNDEDIKDEDKIDIQDVKLLVLDDEGKPEKEVLTDGKGTEVPIGAESITPSPSVSGTPSVTGSPSSPGVPSVPGTEPSVTGTPAVTPTTTPTVTPGGDETPVVTPPSATETPTATPSVGTETPAVSPTPIVTPSITPTPTNTPTPGGNIGNGVMVKKLKIIGSSKRIAAGKKLKLKVAVSPANATNKAVTWKSSNTKYATVNSKGIVTIKKAAGGKTVIITATAKDGSGIKASYKIQCMKGIVKKVTIVGKKTRTIKAGKSIKLKVKVNATKGANKTLKWSSSNTKYATVNSKGKVTTKKAGKGKTIKITATATDGSGKKASVKVKIK